MKKISFLFLLVAAFCSVSGQKKVLAFNLVVGDTYYLSISATNVVKQELSGQEITISTSVSGRTAFKVKGLTDSLYDIIVTYEKLGFTMKLPGNEMSFSSDKVDETDFVSNAFRSVIGKEFYMKLTKSGRVLEVKNLDAIFAGMVEGMEKMNEQQKLQMKEQILQSYGEAAFKGNFEMATHIYTSTPVSKGDKWTIATNLVSGMASTMVTEYEFLEIIGENIVITGNGRIGTTGEESYKMINGMPARYNLSGTVLSTLKVDNKTGWINTAKVKHIFEGNTEIKDNPNLPGGMTIPLTMVSQMSYDSAQF